MQMTRRTDGIFVVSGLPENGSAHRSGQVEVGDVICCIDGEPLEGMSMHFAASLICGPVGTQVNLTLLRGTDLLQDCANFLDDALLDGGYARLLRISPLQC
jgi:C-terminal processing protease CtpA/Prc